MSPPRLRWGNRSNRRSPRWRDRSIVVGSGGDRVGRIEEFRAEQQGDEWVIIKYLVGAAALAERLSIRSLVAKTLGFFGMHDRHHGFNIPWQNSISPIQNIPG